MKRDSERTMSARREKRSPGNRLILALLLWSSLWSPSLLAQKSARGQGELASTSRTVEQLVAKLNPAVVEIKVKAWEVSDSDEEPEHAGYLIHNQTIGAGILLTSTGEILTNHHVIRGAEQIAVHLLGSTKSLSARIIGDDPETDLALLKIEGSGLSHFDLRSGNPVRQGQMVLALGSPFGLGHSVSLGVVSSPSRELDNDAPTTYIQTDAPLNPGNSGGPLVDLDGHVVGINTLMYTHSGGSEGVGFAIPIDTVRLAVNAMEKYGSVKRPYLGIYFQPVTEMLAHGLRLAENNGLLIDDVEQNSPAAEVGIVPGDVILSANEKAVWTLNDLQEVLNALHPGQSMRLEIEHSRTKTSIALTPVFDGPQHLELMDYVNIAKDSVPQLGIVATNLDARIRNLFPTTRFPDGVVVAAKCDGSTYDTDELKAGDILHQVNGYVIRDVPSLRLYLQRTAAHEVLVIQIERSERLMYVALTPED